MKFKYKFTAAKAKFIDHMFRHRMSETCHLLVEQVEKVGYGNMPYMLRDTIHNWAWVSSNWVDKYVLAVEMDKDAEAKVKGLVLVNITKGWKEEKLEVNFVRGYQHTTLTQTTDTAERLEEAMRLAKQSDVHEAGLLYPNIAEAMPEVNEVQGQIVGRGY
jgi:hypothetical protein